jgi:hypothetical protein
LRALKKKQLRPLFVGLTRTWSTGEELEINIIPDDVIDNDIVTLSAARGKYSNEQK